MRARVNAALLLGGAFALLVGVARANDDGCLAIGQGPTVAPTQCTYTALTDNQTVVVATPNIWSIGVERFNCPVWVDGCQPVLVDGCQPAPENQCAQRRNSKGEPIYTSRWIVLAQGEGTPAGAPPTVHPKIGELVVVSMEYAWFQGAPDFSQNIGRTGFIWVNPPNEADGYNQ